MMSQKVLVVMEVEDDIEGKYLENMLEEVIGIIKVYMLLPRKS